MSEPTRILLVEDNPAHAELIARAFEDDGAWARLVFAQTLVEARAAICAELPDLALVDMRLPDGDGIALVELAGQRQKSFPVIIMTSQGDQRTAVDALRGGALDYVVKSDASLFDLPHVVARALREWRTLLERSQAEEARVFSEARLAGILDIAPQAIIAVDEEAKVTLFNQAAAQIFGYSAEEVIGQPLDILLPECFRGRHGHFLAEFALSGEQRRKMGTRPEIRGLRRDGTEFPAEAAISMFSMDGSHTFTVMLDDITERKASEAQLRQAQRMDALGQLTGGIAHDFNNLLSIVMGNLELLREALVRTPDLAAMATEALESAERGAALTRRLLSFARQRSLSQENVCLNDVVHNMTRMLKRTLGPRISICTRFDAESWKCEVDPSALENALLNLCINARDAMDGCGTMSIETSAVAGYRGSSAAHGGGARGDFVVLSVSDTGVGMTEEVRQRIFEPFFTTKEPGKGTGLGLAMVYGFVRQSRGHIEVLSELGRGTTIKLYLPRSQPAREQPAMVESNMALPAGAGQRILVVDDDPVLRRLAVSTLKRLGYATVEASSAEEAASVITQSSDALSLVFSDVLLPGGRTGVELVDLVLECRPGLPVLLTSGAAPPQAEDDGEKRRPWHFLPKPYYVSDLARHVSECIGSYACA